MPVYNRAKSVRRAIDSLKIGEKRAYELIVVDDGSTDGSADAAREAVADWETGRACVLEQANAGPGAARNAGARLARGEFLAFVDSDDQWYHWTAVVIESILRTRRPALTFLHTINFPHGQTPPALLQDATEVSVFEGFLEAVASEPPVRFGSGTSLVRRDLFEEVGGFSRDVHCAEDTDLFLRLASRGECLIVAAPTLAAIETQRSDSLTGQTSGVFSGVNYVIAGDAAGRYRGDQRLREALIAKLVVNAVKTAFAEGKTGAAYGFLVRRFPLIWRGRNWRWIVRLPIYPVLAMLKPQSFALGSRKG